MDASDADLIQAYLAGSQEAFAALVRRHLDLVYSAARRQTQSSALAEDVTQIVFLKLSRHAGQLPPGAPLPAWLYTTTRHAAIDLLRQESRRRAREHTASEIHAMHTAPSPWSQVEPLLDEAMASLPDPDRDVLLHRYFANKSLRDVGAALGITDDAAQKRVSRALDQLRTLLAQRGVALTAAGLATDLSAHAIETAPLTLGTTISAGSFLTTTAGVAALEATKNVAMTTIQKTAIAAALALIAGTAWYEARAVQLGSTDLQRNAAIFQQLQDRVQLAQQKKATTQRQLASVRQEIARVQAGMTTQVPIDAAMEKEMRAFLEQIQLLKQAFSENPQSRIPELDLLTEQDWLGALQNQQPFTAAKTRQMLAMVRTSAKSKVRTTLNRAWATYLFAHDEAPGTIQELEPYFQTSISQEILARYDIRPAERVGSNPPQIWIEEKPIPSDIEFDNYLVTVPAAGGTGYYYNNRPALEYHAQQARETFQREHGGQLATDPIQLLPYLPQAVDPAKLKPYLNPPGAPR